MFYHEILILVIPCTCVSHIGCRACHSAGCHRIPGTECLFCTIPGITQCRGCIRKCVSVIDLRIRIRLYGNRSWLNYRINRFCIYRLVTSVRHNLTYVICIFFYIIYRIGVSRCSVNRIITVFVPLILYISRRIRIRNCHSQSVAAIVLLRETKRICSIRTIT